jgi:Tol biopolymer transport system component
VLAPDGHMLAFARERERERMRPNGRGGEATVYESTSVWFGDLESGSPRRITPWRNRLRQYPSSFSSDGRTLAVTRLVADKPPEAIGIELDGGADSVLVRNALEPVYSPDGTRLAFLRGKVEQHGNTTARVTDLYVKGTGGGGLVRVSRTARALELSPSWDPSGQRLAWIEWNPFPSEAAFAGLGNKLMQANADGSCPTKTISYRDAAIFAASWQPGAGREAGPIAC